ncbi:MAG: tRNA (adenosine(37)-N6)-dimethylallyltransferase MiaA [Clostridia bacterium]|nr:tRNA (adenosine(37)-N6)-dimethylallyltransferase MiaA [Clostridia bacterium]
MNGKSDVIVIGGATASGKSACALDVCSALGGELISCDSMQVYKYMDVGTAKPTKEESLRVAHHLIDIKMPYEEFSSSDYCEYAKNAIDGVISRGRLPVICGGTGLYLDSLMYLQNDDDTACDKDVRERLLLNDKHENWLELQKIDPRSAQSIHENNVKRVVRALEIYYTTGRTKTENDKLRRSDTGKYDYHIFVISYKNREILYERINKRVDIMLENGLLDEIKYLLEHGLLRQGTTAYQAIGYKELISYLNSEATYEQAIEELKRATRNYAKRQITWFSRYKDAEFIYADELGASGSVSSHVIKRIEEKGVKIG